MYLRSAELPVLTEERVEGGIRLSWENYPELRFDLPVQVTERDVSRFEYITTDGRLHPLPAGARVRIDPENRVFRDFGYREWCADNGE